MPTSHRRVTTERLASDLDHPEGVAWDPRGRLVTAGESGQIYRIDVCSSTGELQPELIANTGGYPLGIAVDGDGRAYVCDAGRCEVVRVDLDTGALETYARGNDDEVMVAPNFPVFTDSGHLLVSDSGDWAAGNGKIWAIAPGGACRVVSRQPSGFANGLAIDPAGTHLYVVESSRPRVSRMSLLGDAALGPSELVFSLPYTVPDGLCFIGDGSLLVTCYRPDRIYHWTGSDLEVFLDDWQALSICAPTNAAFFGADLDRLAVANLGDRFLTEVVTGLRGAALNRPTGLE